MGAPGLRPDARLLDSRLPRAPPQLRAPGSDRRGRASALRCPRPAVWIDEQKRIFKDGVRSGVETRRVLDTTCRGQRLLVDGGDLALRDAETSPSPAPASASAPCRRRTRSGRPRSGPDITAGLFQGRAPDIRLAVPQVRRPRAPALCCGSTRSRGFGWTPFSDPGRTDFDLAARRPPRSGTDALRGRKHFATCCRK